MIISYIFIGGLWKHDKWITCDKYIILHEITNYRYHLCFLQNYWDVELQHFKYILMILSLKMT